MRKTIKYSSSIALWLAVAAILAHMVIPHDHHIGGSYSDEDLKCPASHQEQGHKSEVPVHCHAFNDLASERARFFHLPHYISHVAGDEAILQDDFVYDIFLICSGITVNKVPVPASFSCELPLQRAPPVSA